MQKIFLKTILISAGFLSNIACNHLVFAQDLSQEPSSSQSSVALPKDLDITKVSLGNLSEQVSLQRHDLKDLKSQITDVKKKINYNSRLIDYLNTQLMQIQIGSKLTAAKNHLLPQDLGAKHGKKDQSKISEDSLYNKAFNLLSMNKHKKAIAAFNSFLEKNPKTIHANEINYLLGQLYLITDNNDYAMSSFKKVTSDYPKAPEAVLQVGRLYLLNGDAAHAKQFLEKVMKSYPESDAADHAKHWLNTMK
jgi:tol-pal system protein YbgF